MTKPCYWPPSWNSHFPEISGTTCRKRTQLLKPAMELWAEAVTGSWYDRITRSIECKIKVRKKPLVSSSWEQDSIEWEAPICYLRISICGKFKWQKGRFMHKNLGEVCDWFWCHVLFYVFLHLCYLCINKHNFLRFENPKYFSN